MKNTTTKETVWIGKTLVSDLHVVITHADLATVEHVFPAGTPVRNINGTRFEAALRSPVTGGFIWYWAQAAQSPEVA